jgi:hypothetical protein
MIKAPFAYDRNGLRATVRAGQLRRLQVRAWSRITAYRQIVRPGVWHQSCKLFELFYRSGRWPL